MKKIILVLVMLSCHVTVMPLDIGISKGICVVLGDQDCQKSIPLAQKSDLLIFTQFAKKDQYEAACQSADSAGLYGTRINIGLGPLKKIHLADNLADAVVVLDGNMKVNEKEVLRVLHPNGLALIGNKKISKPFPKTIDSWSHPYHGPDNNPFSNDKVIKAPFLTQFLALPRYGPHPQVAVACSGIVFKAFGHIAYKQREEPLLNTLAAFNGYNGTLLWKRKLTPGIVVHRNTMVALPGILYLGDDKSCKYIDPKTGKVMDEFVTDKKAGTFWKWLAFEDNVLYAVVGAPEPLDTVAKHKRARHGWSWGQVSAGYNQDKYEWGFGRNLIAFNPKTKKVLWTHMEKKPIDARAACMKNGRIFIFRFGSFLACIDSKSGKPIWRKTPSNAPEIFKALGDYQEARQSWQTNWKTAAYMKCNDKALYFAGPQIGGNLLAVSAKDGNILWQFPSSNFQLVLHKNIAYAFTGQTEEALYKRSKMFHALTGKVLREFPIRRRACTRPNACADGIFFRARGGTTRFDLSKKVFRVLSPMRPDCHDGVTIAGGFLYWWPSVCDCNFSLNGLTCIGPAGKVKKLARARYADRFEKGKGAMGKVKPIPVSKKDWTTYRKDNTRSAATPVAIPEKVKILWQTNAAKDIKATAPTTAGNIVFYAKSNGLVYALEGSSGKVLWKAYTGGEIRFPPTLANGRALVGSGDGYVYTYEASTGRLLWRFQAAPAQRLIPVYGSLLNTWPVASGVLVHRGIAYLACGMLNYDGTHVYALQLRNGRIKWQNNTSGQIDRYTKSGVSVQGHLLFNDNLLYLAGGNMASPAAFNIKNGTCLFKPQPPEVFGSHAVRGQELYLLGDKVEVAGKPFYSKSSRDVFDYSVFEHTFLSSMSDRSILWASILEKSADGNLENNHYIKCYPKKGVDSLLIKKSIGWAEPHISGINPFWEKNVCCVEAVAVTNNSVVIASGSHVLALNLSNGQKMWKIRLPGGTQRWGLAVDRDGRIIVTLKNGQIVCLG
jgi:outer membrane protein assembly factor BamB